MNKKTKYLTTQEIQELFDVIKNDTSRHAIRNNAIFRLGRYCALRASEIGMLCFSDYDPITHQLLCRRLKNGLDNTLRIVDHKTLEALEAYLEIRQYETSLPLFCSQEQLPISRQTLDSLMKKYCQKTSIPLYKRHFHVLRHTRAIEILEASGNIYDAQFWLGHRNISNTQIYLQYTTKQQEHLYQLLQQKEGGNL